MKTNAAAPIYKRHRYPAEIIAHTVWLYFRFSLSFRAVEELMAARGVMLSYETVRRWTHKFVRTVPTASQYVPRVIIPPKLASYGAATGEIRVSGKHRQHKRLNNRA